MSEIDHNPESDEQLSQEERQLRGQTRTTIRIAWIVVGILIFCALGLVGFVWLFNQLPSLDFPMYPERG